jgi:hypothetical protein
VSIHAAQPLWMKASFVGVDTLAKDIELPLSDKLR